MASISSKNDAAQILVTLSPIDKDALDAGGAPSHLGIEFGALLIGKAGLSRNHWILCRRFARRLPGYDQLGHSHQCKSRLSADTIPSQHKY